VAVVTATGASAFTAAVGWARFGAPDPVAIAVLAVLAAGLLLAPVGPTAARGLGLDLRAIGWTLGAVALLLAPAGYADLTHHLAWSGSWLLVASGCAAVVLLPGQCSAGTRGLLAAVGAVAAGQVLPLAAVDPHGTAIAVTVALAVAGAVPLVLSVRRGLGLPGILAATSLWLVTFCLAQVPHQMSARQFAAFLTVPAAALFLVAVLPALAGSTATLAWLVPRASRWPMAWIAAALASVAVWAAVEQRTLAPLGELALEGRTLPAAALLLIAGLAVRWLRGRGGSLAVAGPALLMALGPATVAAVGESRMGDSATRPVVVILVGVLLAAAGAGARLRAPVLIGGAAGVITGLAQLSTVIDLVPRWVVLGIGGALLLAAGFGYEALFRVGRHAVTAARGLR
jgi:hypothetical protein